MRKKLTKKQIIFWVLWIGGIVIASILLSIFATSCTKQVTPQIVTQEKIIFKEKIDTFKIVEDDTCNQYKQSFNLLINDYESIIDLAQKFNDSLSKLNYSISILKVENTLKKQPRIRKNKGTIIANNSDSQISDIVGTNNQKPKDNSAIGNNNDLKKTTKKTQWWWIFLAGFLTAHLLRLLIKKYI